MKLTLDTTLTYYVSSIQIEIIMVCPGISEVRMRVLFLIRNTKLLNLVTTHIRYSLTQFIVAVVQEFISSNKVGCRIQCSIDSALLPVVSWAI